MKLIKTTLIILAFLALGFFIANEINGFLAIDFKEKTSIELAPKSIVKKDTNTAIRNLGLRIIDLGGVGIIPDSLKWGSNYEHNTHRFEGIILPEAPFIDSVAFTRVEGEMEQFVNRAKSFYYNGIVIHGFTELINFDKLGNGYEVYHKGDEYRTRHLAFRKYFGKLMEIAHRNGLKVYASTDMTTFTTPLKNYMLKKFGKINTENKELWSIYQTGAEEIFETMPNVDGFLLRIGEAGTVYNRPGWDYFSELNVTSDKALKLMLESFIDVAEKHNKLIIFRTWSVGVGEVGDMHTNSQTYHRILDSIDSPNLVVSTKYCSGDFYSWLPYNPTLSIGKHRRITEFQCRREYEGMNSFPNYLAPLHQQVFQKFANENEHFEGFWQWSQEGGPLRAGPLSIYPFHGFNVITDANVFATSKLAQNPYADIKDITKEWIRIYFGDDSLLVNNITDMLLMSHDITREGLYITEFAKYDVRALGLEPPPMMWIFEWDIVGAASSALGSIYYVCKPNLDDAVNEGYKAVEGVKTMKLLATSVSRKVSKNKSDYDKLIASLDYQENLFTVLAHYRSYFLHYFHWLDTGDNESSKKWQSSLKAYVLSEKVHQEKYANNLDFPAYNFREANAGAMVSSHNINASWASRLLLLTIVLSILLTFIVKQKQKRESLGINGLSELWKTLVRPSYVSDKILVKNDKIIVSLFLFICIAGGLYIFSSFSAPMFVLYLLICATLYVCQLRFWLVTKNTENKFNSLLPLVGALLIIFFPLAIASFRGPMLFWYLFWTSASFRFIFFSLFVFSVLWSYYIVYATARGFFKFNRLNAFATILLIQAIQLIAGAAIIIGVGFEKTLTIFNDELLVLPGGLSRILGITTHLNIPVELPIWVMYIGLILGGIGFCLFFINKQKK
ncbi:MAG: hypothetical protein WBM13_10000 [Bacteroidia bacterium]